MAFTASWPKVVLHIICVRKASDEIVPLLSKLIIEKDPSKDDLRAWCVAQTPA
jgi:hypothetical protein